MHDTSAAGRLLPPLFLILACVPGFVLAQHDEPDFETLSLDQGAPTIVQCILQDRTGYLWFATWSGLYRYDGYSFVSYKHELDDTTSLFDNTLTVLYEDKAGVLWVGSYLGLDRFDRGSETFVHYTPNPSDTGSNKSNQVRAICEDTKGVLWVGTGNGVYKFDRATEEFTSLRHDSSDPGSISHSAVNAILEDKGGSLWFRTDRGLDRLDHATGKFIHHWKDPNKPQLENLEYWFGSMYEDEGGVIWLGTRRGLLEYYPKEGTFFTYLFIPKDPINHITSISQDVLSGRLWLATRDGLFSFDKKSKAFTHYDTEANYVCSERSGTLWVGTKTEIRKLNRTKQPFTKYATKETICGITNGTEGILWMYYDPFGWLKFDIRKEQFIPYSFGEDWLFYVWIPVPDISIRLKEGGLYIQDTLGNITFSLDSSWESYLYEASYAIKTRRGYWCGFDSGDLDFWEPGTNRVRKVRNFKQRIYWMYEDRFDQLWIATLMGKLFCFKPEKDSVIDFTSETTHLSKTTAGRINQIYEDKKGRLWFATTTGLNRLERSTGRFVQFTERDGLRSNNICGILEDDHGLLWLNTTKGISRFDPQTNQCKNYDISYGIKQAADVFLGYGCRTGNGEMFFPGAKGFTRFHPDSIRDNPFVPPIVITSFKKFDRPYPFSHEIRLPYDENFISFEFAALSFISPERNQYAYMLEGLDRNWVHSGTRRYASYPGLEPGEYVFRVKGSNNDGVWNEAGTTIAITISPPWWKSRWAYALYALALLSAAYGAWRLQMRRIRVRHEFEMSKFEAAKLHEVDELKSRFFANISHEFRTPLTLIMGPVKHMQDDEEDPQKRENLGLVHKNATRLLELVNQLLDLSRLESGNMKLQAAPENVVPLLNGLLQSFCSYAERKRITMAFTSSEESISVYVDRDKLQKIITNILGNAFKFTPEGGRVELSVAQESQYMNIRISDTGIGIPAGKIPRIFDRFYQVDGSHTREQEGTGIGLSLTRELVELHKGTITVESEEGRGSVFTVRLPLGRAHLLAEEIRDSGVGETTHEEKGVALPAVEIAPEGNRPDKAATIPLKEEGKPLLLIVEDNADVRQYVRRDLEGEYSILEAVDGADGWSRSLEHIPDIIISDIMMPKMDGYALCDRLKTDERTSHIPVILLTAKAASQDKIKGFQTGADDYIMKPFEQAELRARLRNLLEQRKRLHEHFRKHGLFEIEVQKITPVDQKFLQNALSIITERMAEPGFGVETLAERMAVSHSLLLKKVEALTGEPPVDLIKRTRLSKAAKLIEAGFGNTFQVALEVGFSSPSYFTKCFKQQFGVNPSEYRPSAVKGQA